MKFMMLVRAAEGLPPNPALYAAIGQLAEEMAQSGRLVDMGGLAPSANGARIRLAGGKLGVTDGPFAESKEVIGGYAILRAASKDDALELGRRFMQVHADILGPGHTMELEVREMDGVPEVQS